MNTRGSKPGSSGHRAREEGTPTQNMDPGNKTRILPYALPTCNEEHKCPNCGKLYQKLANLSKHVTTCKSKPISSPNKCRFCHDRFNTPAGARQHERKRHPDQYHLDLGQQLREPDSEMYRKIADIEANYDGKKHLNNKIAEDTGLTISQIIHKRRAPVYKLYLDNALKRKLDSTQPDVPTDPTLQPSEGHQEVPETWYQLVGIELKATAGSSFFKLMSEATGLSNYKIRTIRESIEYKKFLNEQRVSLAENEPQQPPDNYQPSQAPHMEDAGPVIDNPTSTPPTSPHVETQHIPQGHDVEWETLETVITELISTIPLSMRGDAEQLLRDVASRNTHVITEHLFDIVSKWTPPTKGSHKKPPPANRDITMRIRDLTTNDRPYTRKRKTSS